MLPYRRFVQVMHSREWATYESAGGNVMGVLWDWNARRHGSPLVGCQL